MAAQEPNELQLYRISALVGQEIRTMQTTGWSGLDAMDRISKRLHSEGHHLFTLNILERKKIQ